MDRRISASRNPKAAPSQTSTSPTPPTSKRVSFSRNDTTGSSSTKSQLPTLTTTPTSTKSISRLPFSRSKARLSSETPKLPPSRISTTSSPPGTSHPFSPPPGVKGMTFPRPRVQSSGSISTTNGASNGANNGASIRIKIDAVTPSINSSSPSARTKGTSESSKPKLTLRSGTSLTQTTTGQSSNQIDTQNNHPSNEPIAKTKSILVSTSGPNSAQPSSKALNSGNIKTSKEKDKMSSSSGTGMSTPKDRNSNGSAGSIGSTVRPRSSSMSTSSIISKASSATQPSTPRFAWQEGRKYHRTPGAPYFLPIDEGEAYRLKLEHHIIKYVYNFRNFHAPVHEVLEMGGKCLDVGCGPGTWGMEMAEDFPQAEFHLIDLSSSLYLAADRTKPHNCYFKALNALERLPFEDDTFDFIHHRGMGLAYREEDWGRVMNELYRILKPGGWIELCESDGTIYSWDKQGKETMTFMKKMNHLFKARELKSDVAHELPLLLTFAGFVNIEDPKYSSVPVGAWGRRIGKCCRQNIVAMLEAMKPLYTEAWSMKPSEYDILVEKMGLEFDETRTFMNYHRAWGQKPKPRSPSSPHSIPDSYVEGYLEPHFSHDESTWDDLEDTNEQLLNRNMPNFARTAMNATAPRNIPEAMNGRAAMDETVQYGSSPTAVDYLLKGLLA